MAMQATPRLPGLTVKSTWGMHTVDIKARWQRVQVGKISCFIQPDARLRLDMIEVEEVVAISRVFRWLPSKRHRMRGKGIGKHMLDELVERAKTQHVTEIWGEIPAHLHEAWSELPAWYQRHGFKVSQPDDECHGDSVFKVTCHINRG